MIFLSLWVGCKSVPSPAPDQTYDEIRQDFIHGNLGVALQEVQKAHAVFYSDPQWEIRFKLLQAEILTYQGLAIPVINLLSCDAMSSPLSGDPAIKRDILCAREEIAVGNVTASDHDISEAETLSAKTASRLSGELLGTEALIADEYKNRQEDAILLYQKSLNAARVSHDTFLEAGDLLDLGMMALDQEHFDEALDFFARSSALAQKIGAQQILQAGLGNSGLAYLYLGDSVHALTNFKQAETEATGRGVVSDQIAWLWDEGLSYYRLGSSMEAEAAYQRALERARTIPDFNALAGLYTELGFLQYEKGNYGAASSFSKDALQSAASSRNHFAYVKPLLLQALIATHEPDSRSAVAQLLRVYQGSTHDSELRSAAEDALGNLYRRDKRTKEAASWYEKAIYTFEAQRNSVKAEELRLPFFATGEAIYRDYASFLIESHRPDEALSLLDKGRARTLSEGLGQTTGQSQSKIAIQFRPQDTAKKLNTTILFYALGPDKSYLWAINSKQMKLFTLPKASELQSAIQSYSKSLQRSSDPLKEPDRDGTYLYQSLIRPASAMLSPNARVVVVPDGVLNQLNFETLLAPGASEEKAHYWIEDATITNASSIRMLARSAGNPPTDTLGNVLLIGNPANGNSGFEPLPHAASELLAVANKFPRSGQTVVAKSAAVPSSYAGSSPENYAYIHFVAHGTASLLNPLDSAIILSPAPQNPESFKLYAREIIRHPIHAKLVTISACNGSGLRAYAGEGLVGLSWAFLRAGAHNVIAALWQVDDAATPLIMDHLYTDLQAHHTAPEAALRNAKLSLIHSTGAYRKPLYWAAFQLYTGS